MPREWDARTYDELPLPHLDWGNRTLQRLDLVGNETVLDAGAGTGRDTEKLLDLVPDGRVIAADASTAMLDKLKDRLGEQDRVEPLLWDLTEPLPDRIGRVGAIFSVATFHWIFDHDQLFANLSACANEGAKLAAECGGQGNVESIDKAVAKVLGHAREQRWHFADVDSTTRRLIAAGFEPTDVQLRPHPVTLEDPALFRTYLATIVLGSHLDAMGDKEGEEFLTAVIEELNEPTVDYVRLEISAERSAAA